MTDIEEELEKITPPTDEPIPLSKLSTFDDAQGVNETGVIEEISKTETDVANKTQDNSGDEIPVVKVELPPAVINSSQQNESSDVAQDRSDVISERMQQIIVGGDEEDVENSEGKNKNPSMILISLENIKTCVLDGCTITSKTKINGV